MLDEKTIEKLQEPECIEHINREIAGKKLERPVVATPDNVTLKDLEGFLPAPTRKRGTMATESIDGFTSYVEANKSALSSCFVSQCSMSANAIIDHGTTDNPAHNQHNAVLTLEKTSDFKDLLAIDKDKRSQRNTAEWVEEHIDTLTFYKDAALSDEISATKAITAIRKVKDTQKSESESTVGNFSETRGVMASASIEDDNLPAFIAMTIEPYNGLPTRKFVARLAYHRDSEAFSLRIIRLDKQFEEMAEEFSQLVTEKLGDVPVFIGEYAKSR